MRNILFFGFLFISNLFTHIIESGIATKKEKRSASVKNLHQFVQMFPSTRVRRCTYNYKFNYKPFPLREIYGKHLWHPSGIFQDIFILEVNNGLVYINPEEKEFNKYSYYLFVNDIFLKECSYYHFTPKNLSFHDATDVQYIKGRVAVAHHLWYPEYGHFILDVLSSLALLEMYKIDYDYLLVPYEYQYMKDIFMLWGIDSSKIIPIKENQPIKADVLIFNTSIGVMRDKFLGGFGLYRLDPLIKYIRDKLVQAVNDLNLSIKTSNKIFLSKKDSVMGGRNIPNEEEIFKEFEKLGYERCEFAKMPIAEKIYRVNKATHFVSSVGSGSLHAIFLEPNKNLIEIQTTYPESSFCYLVQNLGINYYCLNCTNFDDIQNNNWLTAGKNIPIEIIQNYIKHHPEL